MCFQRQRPSFSNNSVSPTMSLFISVVTTDLASHAKAYNNVGYGVTLFTLPNASPSPQNTASHFEESEFIESENNVSIHVLRTP